MKQLLLVLFSAVLCVGLLSAPASAASVSGSYESTVIKKTNKERVKKRMKSLKPQSCVDRYAEKQARNMAKKKKLYHQNMRTVLKKCKLRRVGENVAAGYPNATGVVNAWMRSRGHRANILTKQYRIIGVGAVKRGRIWYVAQVFGTK